MGRARRKAVEKGITVVKVDDQQSCYAFELNITSQIVCWIAALLQSADFSEQDFWAAWEWTQESFRLQLIPAVSTTKHPNQLEPDPDARLATLSSDSPPVKRITNTVLLERPLEAIQLRAADPKQTATFLK